VRRWLLQLDERAGFGRGEDGVWEENLRRWRWGLALGAVWLVVAAVLGRSGSGLGLLAAAPLVLLLAFHSGYFYAQRLASLGRTSRFRGLRPPEPSGERDGRP
jgi:uncharacterized protein (DUF58 family)